MLLRLMATLALLLLSIPAAEAASFDCAKAGNAIESAICSNPALSEADDTLAKAYATAIGGLSQPAVAAMRQGQRNWLDFRAASCADDALRGDDDIGQERVDCLKSAYAGRIKTLEKSRMMGGLRFYNIDRYAVVPDPDAEESGFRVATKSLSYTLIDGSDAFAQAFNAIMHQQVSAAGSMFDVPGGGDDDPASGTTDEDVSYEARATASGPVGVTINTYAYGHGAAHGNYSISHLHVLRDQMRLLVASDIFTGNAWKRQLRGLVLDRLKSDLGDGLMLDDPSAIDDTMTDPAHWDFSDGGLVIQFEPYEVAAYAAGAVTVTIPWTALESDLTDNAWAIIGY